MRPGPAPPPFDRQFGRALCSFAGADKSGIVTATRGKRRRLFCIEGGRLVYAASNLVEEQFAEYLVRSGVLTPSDRAAAVQEAERTKVKLSQAVVGSGRLDLGTLERAMAGLVEELVASTLEWPDGQATVQAGLPRLEDEVKVSLSPVELVLGHAQRTPGAAAALRVRIGPPDFRPIVAAAVPPGIELDPVGRYLLLKADGGADLATLVAGSPAGEEPTVRAVYGFLLAGWLEAEDAARKRAREGRGREPDLTRDECLGRLAVASGRDHYTVLGIERTARREKVREAYYALARRYHPDRFRSGELSDLLPRFEEFFTRVTEAYNTLSEPARRAEYDEQLQAAPAATQETKGPDTGYLARQNYLRGKALASHRKYTEAVTFLENAVQLDPGQADYHLELGIVLALNPRHREAAERQLLQAIDLSPALPDAYVALGQMYLKAGRPGRAGRMAREALRWEPGHAAASRLLAEAGDEADDRDEGGPRAVFGRS